MRIVSLFVTLLFALPAASADTTYECALDPAPPCARVTHAETTGDGDCDASNGAGSRRSSVDVWTGANPAGNQSVSVVNECDGYSRLTVDVLYLMPGARYDNWVWIGWYHFGGTSCYAWIDHGGHGNLARFSQDLGPVLCQAGAPPTLP